jgi:hypothetical protein
MKQMRILEDEIAGDPLGRGYSGMTDAQLLDSLNTANRNRDRTEMTGREVKAQVNVTEYNALTDAKKQQMIELLKQEDLNLFGLDKNILADIFGGGSTTGINLATARVESISRGVEIGWGMVKEMDLRMHTLSRK